MDTHREKVTNGPLTERKNVMGNIFVNQRGIQSLSIVSTVGTVFVESLLPLGSLLRSCSYLVSSVYESTGDGEFSMNNLPK